MDSPSTVIWADNLNRDAWYYAEVQEAINSHTYDQGDLHEIWETVFSIRNWAELEKIWSDEYDGHN